jgi:hypothetical protein
MSTVIPGIRCGLDNSYCGYHLGNFCDNACSVA